MKKTRADESSTITAIDFQDLLRLLDQDSIKAVEKFNALRNRLGEYFDRKGIVSEELLNKTFETLLTKVQHGEAAEDVERQAISIAVVLGRGYRHGCSIATDVPAADAPIVHEDVLLDCLRSCVSRLAADDRQLISRYFDVKKGRAKAERRGDIATRLGLTANALRIRVHKVRISVEDCVGHCVEARLGRPLRELWRPRGPAARS